MPGHDTADLLWPEACAGLAPVLKTIKKGMRYGILESCLRPNSVFLSAGFVVQWFSDRFGTTRGRKLLVCHAIERVVETSAIVRVVSKHLGERAAVGGKASLLPPPERRGSRGVPVNPLH